MAQHEPSLFPPNGTVRVEDAAHFAKRVSHPHHINVRAAVQLLVVQHRLDALVVVGDHGQRGAHIEADHLGLVHLTQPDAGLLQVLAIDQQQEEIAAEYRYARWAWGQK